MEQKKLDELGNMAVTVNEYELHDFFAGLYQEIARMFDVHDDDGLEQIVLVPEELSSELCNKWEQKINELLKTVRTLDSSYHDDAEYTC